MPTEAFSISSEDKQLLAEYCYKTGLSKSRIIREGLQLRLSDKHIAKYKPALSADFDEIVKIGLKIGDGVDSEYFDVLIRALKRLKKSLLSSDKLDEDPTDLSFLSDYEMTHVGNVDNQERLVPIDNDEHEVKFRDLNPKYED